MLSQADNDLMCRVGAGSPMGEVMRRYWLPLLYSWELEPDGAPLKVRLLAEDLIAFRETGGQVGLSAEACPHRGASMFFGRNEECGLRCVYHGWKFDVDGACVDMPSEPAESNFKNKVRIKAYRAAEQGGVIWAYLGPDQADPPALPEFEWCALPEDQVHHQYKGIYDCNWMQALEGDIDTSHLYFLHGRLDQQDPASYGVYHPDKAPRLELVETDYGMYYGASRQEGPGMTYWRTTQWLFPIFTMFPANEDGTVPQHMYTPIDDDLTMHWGLRWHPLKKLPGERRLNQNVSKIPDQFGMGAMQPTQHGKAFANWWPVASKENDFLMDREVQRTMNYTGIPTIRLQDAAVIASMGPIYDRSKEHLGTTDAMIIATRRRLIKAAKQLRDEGVMPPASQRPGAYRARSCSTVLPTSVDWKEALKEWHRALTNQVPSEARRAEVQLPIR
ncbi:MAG TPA: Rieske 2Fe-2S domain-containing protein [Dehalococcoidia bacterium]|nr:Rieske 2Fe-2S domain-containing protein [Dehalococcoidia bacterium]